ncbi:MAG TPA: 5-formyltetrahydrofolate cyclo-ligase [Chthoniobacterales bacterium]
MKSFLHSGLALGINWGVSEVIPKSALRRELRLRLRAMSAGERAAASRKIETFVASLPAWQAARRIYAFFPLALEPDLAGWDWAGKSLALPRVRGTELHFCEVADFTRLEFHPWGMGEPSLLRPPAPPPDLVLVPALGFDRTGRRLGRGGGYYDRFLGALSPAVPRIGVGFDCQLCAAVPAEAHDAPLHAVVTESGVCFSPAGQTPP